MALSRTPLLKPDTGISPPGLSFSFSYIQSPENPNGSQIQLLLTLHTTITSRLRYSHSLPDDFLASALTPSRIHYRPAREVLQKGQSDHTSPHLKFPNVAHCTQSHILQGPM